MCLLLEHKVTLTQNGGEPVKFCEGELVVFPVGMKYPWNLHKSGRDDYRFGD